MLGIKKIEMMHFPSRLNVSFNAVDFTDYSVEDKPYFVKTEYLENILDNSIIMTGKYCSEYATKINLGNELLELIRDEFGRFGEEKKLKLKPNYSIDFNDLSHTQTLLYSVTITYPATEISTKLSETQSMTLEQVSDLILKANIKSLSNPIGTNNFKITLLKVNTDYNSFKKQAYSEIPIRQQKDIDNLLLEISNLKIDNPIFLYFYSDKWDSHLANFTYDE